MAKTLSSGVPAPKFHLFQEVYCDKYRGVIVGMQYMCPLEALAQSLRWYGWRYTVSYVFGKAPEQVLKAPDSSYHIPEENLSAWRGSM